MCFSAISQGYILFYRKIALFLTFTWLINETAFFFLCRWQWNLGCSSFLFLYLFPCCFSLPCGPICLCYMLFSIIVFCCQYPLAIFVIIPSSVLYFYYVERQSYIFKNLLALFTMFLCHDNGAHVYPGCKSINNAKKESNTRSLLGHAPKSFSGF